MISLKEIESLENLLQQATDGPWEVGVRYSKSEVNADGLDFALQEGTCWCCSEESPLVREVTEDGLAYHIHKHNETRQRGDGYSLASGGTHSSVVGKEGGVSAENATLMATAHKLLPALCEAARELIEAKNEQVPSDRCDGGDEGAGE